MQKLARFDVLSLSPARIRDSDTGIEYELQTEEFPPGYVGIRAYLNGKFVVRCHARLIPGEGGAFARIEILLKLYRHGFVPYFSNSPNVWEYDRVRFKNNELRKIGDHVSFMSPLTEACKELGRIHFGEPSTNGIDVRFIRNGEIGKKKQGRPFIFAEPIRRIVGYDEAIDLDTGLSFIRGVRDCGRGETHLDVLLDGQRICSSFAKIRRLEPLGEIGRQQIEIPNHDLRKSFELLLVKANSDLEGRAELGTFDEILPTLLRGWKELLVFKSFGGVEFSVSADLPGSL